MRGEIFGKELVLDLHECNVQKFNKKEIKKYFVKLCELIDMERVFEPFFWDDSDEDSPHPNEKRLEGISAVQFIKTSSITCHFMVNLKSIYLNIFSCKDFDEKKAEEFTKDFFNSEEIKSRVMLRE